MIIAFDGKRAANNMTGLGNYSRFVIEVLCRYFPENRYILLVPKRGRFLDGLLKRHPQIEVRYPHGWFWCHFPSLWRVWGIKKDLSLLPAESFYHGLSNELPLNISACSAIKKIVTIHDLIFLRHPSYYKFADRIIYKYKFKKACLNADRIIAVSECTKRDIIQFFNIPDTKISVVYQGCNDIFKHKVQSCESERVRHTHKLPGRYLLNVGTIEERKNILLGLKALPSLPNDLHLVIVGRKTSYYKKIERFVKQNNLSERVHILSDVPLSDLPALYQNAEIFLYPSRYEGFGIPVLEALCSGVPVVAATGSCLEEAGGESSLYVNPDNVTELVKAINKICNIPENRSAREKMINAGMKYVERFTDERLANEIINIYNNL